DGGKEEVELLCGGGDVNSHVVWVSPRLLLQQIVSARDWEGTVLGNRFLAAVRCCPWPLLLRLNRSAGASSPLLRVLAGHTDSVFSVVFSPDGRTLASGSGDGTVRLWDTVTGAERRSLQGHTGWVSAVAFRLDGRALASGSRDTTVRLWDAVTGAELCTLRGYASAVHSVAFSPDGRTLASGSGDHTVRLWDTVTGAELCT